MHAIPRRRRLDDNQRAALGLAAPGTAGYHLLLLGLGIFVPAAGEIAAAYMNFSLGFYVGGQVLAGILGSTVTLGYGAEGKHGAISFRPRPPR